MKSTDTDTALKAIVQTPTTREVATIAIAALAYFFAHAIAFFFPDAEKVIMLIWPAGGVGLAAFLMLPRRLWPALTVSFFIVGTAASVWLADRSVVTGLGYMTANMIESVGCAWLILRASKGFQGFTQTVEVQALILGAAIVNGIGACVGAGTSALTRSAPFFESWLSWYVSDGLGVLVVGPFVVVSLGARTWLSTLSVYRRIEGAVFGALWVAVNVKVFGYLDGMGASLAHPYILIGLLAWPAFRLGQSGVMLTLALLFGLSIASPSTTSGPSPFDARAGTLTDRVLDLQLFLGFAASTAMLLAAGVADRMRAEASLRDTESRFRLATQAANVGLFDWDLVTNEVHYSSEWKRQIGYRDEEVSNRFEEWRDRVHPDDLDRTVEQIRAYLASPSRGHAVEFRFRHRDGHYLWILTQASLQRGPDGRPVRMLGSHIDVTDLKEDEVQLAESERKYRELFEGMNAGFVAFEVIQDDRGNPVDLVIEAANAQFAAATGLSLPGAIGSRLTEALPGIENDTADWIGTYGKVALTGEPQHSEQSSQLLGAHFSIAAYQAGSRRCAATFVDITKHKQAEGEKSALQEQLVQAQKMESIGRLAGGVAHDFNNLLQVILLNIELAETKLTPDSSALEHLKEIEESAKRSADLTRQLLAFARKQTIAPRVLDLNEAIEGTLKMLRRLIGEDIVLAWLPGGVLDRVNMDPAQVDQILANLCVNARDAIGGNGGKVTIQTSRATLDAEYVAAHPSAVAGQYVRLTVSDTGCGMTAEIRANLFEPFYTTKGPGQGTGLGLATVYGIVKQNNGLINVHSEPGQGSTFEILLPRIPASALHSHEEASPRSLARGWETILLVEDERPLLSAAQQSLERLGYTVLAADTPTKAIELTKEREGRIDLLVTDVVMPDMNGRELAERIQALCPHLPCLFMSGYTADVIAHHGVLDPDVHFIHKPYSLSDLASKVREALRASRDSRS